MASGASHIRGFTLIELMVALTISSLLVGMILSIFARMSLAYRGQQQIASVQQVLAAARDAFDTDAKQAGLEMAQGFSIGSDVANLHSPVLQVNNSTGPDQIAFFYADLTSQALVTGGDWTAVTVDSAIGFANNDVIVVSTAQAPLPGINPGDAQIATFDACALQIQSIAGNTITFSQSAPWGGAGNAGCTFTIPAPTANKSMVYKLVAHAYRIDPDPLRAVDGVLQMSPTGNLFGLTDWQDMGYGFTDIQTAMQFYDGDLIDSDSNGDPARDWWSNGQQQTYTTPVAKPGPFTYPLQMSISLVARTDRDVEGIATAATPALIVNSAPNNNQLGDHDTVTLPSVTDTHLQGQRIYRYVTFKVDLRNIGVGR
jgi:prepilin-type N-terminal cleavage/methylation domain-containing protein